MGTICQPYTPGPTSCTGSTTRPAGWYPYGPTPDAGVPVVPVQGLDVAPEPTTLCDVRNPYWSRACWEIHTASTLTLASPDDEVALLSLPISPAVLVSPSVTATTSVPEPAPSLLLLLALAAAAVTRRFMRSPLRTRVLSLVLLCLLLPLPAAAQTPATYAQRMLLAEDRGFVGRVKIACVLGAITVVMEPPETTEHATRVRLAAYVLREPEFVAQRLTLLLAAVVPAYATGEGGVSTPITDTELSGLLAQRWTLIASALGVSQ